MILLQCIYFMLPAYFANMAPVIVMNLPFLKKLNAPIDLNRSIGGTRIFGSHKTIRGFVFGVLFSVMLAYIQYLLSTVAFFEDLGMVSYDSWFLLGLLMGSGALFGDLIKSFFKRRIRIRPGKPWIPFDQVDFVVGSLVFVYPLVSLPWSTYALVLVISFVLDIGINQLSYFLGVRSEPW